MLSGVYRIPRIASRGRSVVTNTTPVSAYRGAGRPEATALLERVMDVLAAELGMDPVELRRRNLIPPDAFPHETAVGTTYDVGDYERALDEAVRIAGYEDLRAEQAERRARGDRLQLGIGVSAYVEVTAFAGREFGSVEVRPDGTAAVLSGVSPHGQGHETSLAQIASGVLGIPMDRISVIHSDTGVVPAGDGTYGSRSLQLGGTAVWNASEQVLEKARLLAAHLLETSPADLMVHEDGRIGVAGAPELALGWGELAAAASDPTRLPEGMEPGLSASGRFRQKDSTYPFGAHVAVVEVDVETGDARLIRHVAVDDCGRILNPLLVEGQVHGGLAQGIAQALYEGVSYDETGSPQSASLTGYLIPSAAELPAFVTAHTETPTPLNPLGAKGIGESATIGSTPAVQSAVVDALSHLGVRHIDLPLLPERVWRAIRAAAERSRPPSP
jgi:carbon-monoxide dehydrogenase large subunit